MHKGWYKQLEEDDDNGFAEFGGYMEAKKAKLIKQVRQQAGSNFQSEIFKGVSIFVNGHTKPSAEELKVLMGQHSGIYHIYQMPSTTHIIASNLPNVKITKLGPLPIVKPSWIVDSITLGRLLDYTSYLLYTNQTRAQPKINFPKENGDPSRSSSAKTASDPAFLSEFYGNSRLHLIATLGAQSKQFVNELRGRKKKHEFPGLEQLLLNVSKCEQDFPGEDKQNNDFADEHEFVGSNTQTENKPLEVIMHIDMDCFFVSVGLRNHPHLKGKPVAVTHSKTGQGRTNVDRSAEIAMYKNRLPDGADFRLQDIDDNSSLSEIASCSYEARKMGITNGMFMGQALKLCPDLRAIPYDFEGYKEVSRELYKTISKYTLNIEAVSCDEMYVNVTSILQQCTLTVAQFATHIRGIIKERTGCPCSTGFGSNRLQARVATKQAKPDGFFYLIPSEVANYFHDLPVSDLPGVGRATLTKLKHLGLETCGDIQLFNLQRLQKEVGQKLGDTIHAQANGVDKKPLQYEQERKSVSAEVNYGIRFQTKEESLAFLKRLAEEVTSRLIEIEMKAKCITLKVMVRAENAPRETAKFMGHGVCDSMSKSCCLHAASDDASIIYKESKTLYEKFSVHFEELRGVGIQLSRMEKCSKANSILESFLSSVNKANEVKTTMKINESAETPNKQTMQTTSTTNETGKVTKRGRPSKKLKNQPSLKGAIRKSTNLTDFFKSTQKDRLTKSATSTTNSNQISMMNIDMRVLKELPEYIQEEIIKECNLHMMTTIQQTPKRLDIESKEVVIKHKDKRSISPNNSSRNSKEEYVQQNKSSRFDSLTYENFVNMLSKWLETDPKPLQIDVEMLGEYFKEMAIQKKIEKLYIYLQYLHRNISAKDDFDWHHAYSTICDILQEGMMISYGRKLKLPRFIWNKLIITEDKNLSN